MNIENPYDLKRIFLCDRNQTKNRYTDLVESTMNCTYIKYCARIQRNIQPNEIERKKTYKRKNRSQTGKTDKLMYVYRGNGEQVNSNGALKIT